MNDLGLDLLAAAGVFLLCAVAALIGGLMLPQPGESVMKIQPAPRILAVAALCAASLIALVVSEGVARESGQEVLLPMEAVDPRSLLQGHYVQLRLTQRLEPNEPCPQSKAAPNGSRSTAATTTCSPSPAAHPRAKERHKSRPCR